MAELNPPITPKTKGDVNFAATNETEIQSTTLKKGMRNSFMDADKFDIVLGTPSSQPEPRLEQISMDLEDFSDAILFPGYEFGPSEDEKLLNFLKKEDIGLSSVNKDELEAWVLAKYLKNGVLSTFAEPKVNETKHKNYLRFLQNQLDNYYKKQKEYAKEYLDFEEKELNSKIELEKLSEELSDLSLLEVKLFENGEKVVIPQQILKNVKYKPQIEEINIFKSIIEKCKEEKPKLAVLQDKLKQNIHGLEHYLNGQAFIAQQLEETSRIKSNELKVVAKHRYLQNLKRLKSLEKEESESTTSPLKIEYSPSKIVHQKSEILKRELAYLANQKELEESEKNMRAEKKKAALASLKQVIKDLNEKQGKASSLHKPLSKLKQIGREFNEREMDIVKRILDQEFPVVRAPAVKHPEQEACIEITSTQTIDESSIEPNQVNEDSIMKKVEEIDAELNSDLVYEPKSKPKIPLIGHKQLAKSSNQTAFPPFSFDPPLIHIRDWSSETKTTIRLKIVNTSGRGNSFKLLSVPAELTDHINIIYNLPGTMSGGTVWDIKVKLIGNDELVVEKGNILKFNVEFTAQKGGKFALPIWLSPPTCHVSIIEGGGTNLPTIDLVSGVENGSLKNESGSVQAIRLPPLFAQLKGEKLFLDYGICLQGAKKVIWFKIKNQGSIATDIFIEKLDNETKFVAVMQQTHLVPDGICTVQIRFGPEYEKAVIDDNMKVQTEFPKSARFKIRFGETDQEFEIICVGKGKSVPVSVDKHELNFHWCVPEVEYQDNFFVINDFRITRKFWLNFPANVLCINKTSEKTIVEYENFGTVEVFPNTAFIQQQNKCEIWVKVRFTKEAVQKYVDDEMTQISRSFGIVFKDPMTGNDISLPVMIVANLTTYDISITSSTGENFVDFGKATIFERKEDSIVILNNSSFSQVLKITENENFSLSSPEETLILEPHEHLVTKICFHPKDGVEYKEMLEFQSTWNQTYKIPIYGIGIVPPAYFEKSEINFKAIPYNGKLSTRVMLKKAKKHIGSNISVGFQLMKPKLIGLYDNSSIFRQDIPICLPELVEEDYQMLQMWPVTGALNSDCDYTFFEIEARINHIEQPKLENKKSDQNVSMNISNRRRSKVKSIPKVDESAIPKEDWKPELESTITELQRMLLSMSSPTMKWLLPCVLTENLDPKGWIDSLETGVKPNYLPNETPIEERAVYTTLVIPITKSILSLENVPNGVCDFEYQIVGRRKLKSFIIKNNGTHTATLKTKGFSPNGPFFLAKAIRDIEPGNQIQVNVAFEPDEGVKYSQSIEFSFRTSILRVHFRGEGLVPILKADNDGPIDFGDICVGDAFSKTINLQNASKLALFCSIELASSSPDSQQGVDYGTMNYTGKSPFTLSHVRLNILPGEVFALNVNFQPDREHENIFDMVRISYCGRAEPLLIKVIGRGWESSTCILNSLPAPLSYVATSLESPEQRWESAQIQFPNTANENPSKKDAMKDEARAECILAAAGRNTIFSTVEAFWQKSNNSWSIDIEDVILGNLKPNTKLEGGKKTQAAEYSILPISKSFIFDPFLNDYIFYPQEESTRIPNTISLKLMPEKGTIDLGTTKLLKLELVQQDKEFWEKCASDWESLESNHLPSKNSIQTELKLSPSDPRYYIGKRDIKIAGSLKSRASKIGITKPFKIVQVFKISIRGSYRFVEPKGTQIPQETRNIFLKVIINPPSETK